MAILERLKHLVKLDGCSFNFINIQINSNNTSEKFTNLNGGQTLGINLTKLSQAEKELLKPLLPQAVAEGALLLEDKSIKRIEDIESKEKESAEQKTLSFFKGKIPHEDFTALRASLYLRKRFQEGADREEIAELKDDIIRRFSRRGRNISDLCSAGYFDALIRTIFEEMEHSGYSEEEVLDTYNLIVEEGTLTVFVSTGMSPDYVKNETEAKIKRNRRYGLHSLFIHGIGRTNIETIRTVIYDLKESYPTMKIKTAEQANIIKVKLEF